MIIITRVSIFQYWFVGSIFFQISCSSQQQALVHGFEQQRQHQLERELIDTLRQTILSMPLEKAEQEQQEQEQQQIQQQLVQQQQQEKPKQLHRKPLCNVSRGDHTRGSWVPLTAAQKVDKSFICCNITGEVLKSPYSGNSLSGYRESDVDATNICHGGDLLMSFHGATHLLNPESAGGCACDEAQGTRDTVNAREKYRWQPDECFLFPFDRARFCSLLGNRTIWLIGDSTMQQQATTLMNLVTNLDSSSIDDCSSRIRYGKSYMLTFKDHENVPWYSFAENYQVNADIFILTAGAHFQDSGDGVAVFEGLKQQVIDVRNSWKSRDPTNSKKIYWKTQAPGHLNCTAFSEPVKNISVISHDDPNDKFHWSIFRDLDKMSHWYTEKMGIGLIDMSPLYLRPDAHPSLNRLLLQKKADHDCLHYCMPGPLDLFGELLLNMMHSGDM